MEKDQQQDISLFGKLPDGREVKRYLLTNSNGVEVTVIELGCIINSIVIPTAKGPIDVVLGFDTVDDYLKAHSLPAPPYFGAVVGRYAGRIKKGHFKIGDSDHQLNINNNAHTLHGGIKGFDQALWTVTDYQKNTGNIVLQYHSAHGEERFPGDVDIEVTYKLTDDNELQISYKAKSSQDTIINLTQHSYFNLNGHQADLEQQQLLINAEQVIEIDAENIPSGKLIAASEKGFDFTSARTIPLPIDDSFIITDNSKPAAILESKITGIKMTVVSNQPSLHIYVGGNLFGQLKGKEGAAYHPYSGICFESQNYPDAPNQPQFPNAILREGEIYQHETRWKFDF